MRAPHARLPLRLPQTKRMRGAMHEIRTRIMYTRWTIRIISIITLSTILLMNSPRIPAFTSISNRIIIINNNNITISHNVAT